MTHLPSWKLTCPWCEYYVWVNARGGRRADPGSGVESARKMEDHIKEEHQRTWREFLWHTRHGEPG